MYVILMWPSHSHPGKFYYIFTAVSLNEGPKLLCSDHSAFAERFGLVFTHSLTSFDTLFGGKRMGIVPAKSLD